MRGKRRRGDGNRRGPFHSRGASWWPFRLHAVLPVSKNTYVTVVWGGQRALFCMYSQGRWLPVDFDLEHTMSNETKQKIPGD